MQTNGRAQSCINCGEHAPPRDDGTCFNCDESYNVRGIEPFHIGELIAEYPHLHPPVIDGLFRAQETANIISVSKIGKSWLLYSLILSVATGRAWLGRFPTTKGSVLLIDNELHRPTIANRIRTVAEKMEIPPEEYGAEIEVWPLRGNMRNIVTIGADLRRRKRLRLVCIDAKYRMIPGGTSENLNEDETFFYNTVDQYAMETGAAIVMIHHSTKGDQSSKRITDIGAGGGAQSRAADCHLVLREHEDQDTVVLEAAVRSFAPVEPVALQWSYPLWRPVDADCAALKGRQTASDERQQRKDSEGIGQILDVLMKYPATERRIRKDTGLSKDRVERLLGIMNREGRLDVVEKTFRGNDASEYRLKGRTYEPTTKPKKRRKKDVVDEQPTTYPTT